MKGYYFLDLFAGEAGVSRALDREGFQCFAYDVLYGPDGDLSKTHVQNRIKSCIFSGKVLGVLIAPVCSSFSTAMNRVVVLRTKEYPWGGSGPARALAREGACGKSAHEVCVAGGEVVSAAGSRFSGGEPAIKLAFSVAARPAPDLCRQSYHRGARPVHVRAKVAEDHGASGWEP